jgi:hypothetical protein
MPVTRLGQLGSALGQAVWGMASALVAKSLTTLS